MRERWRYPKSRSSVQKLDPHIGIIRVTVTTIIQVYCLIDLFSSYYRVAQSEINTQKKVSFTMDNTRYYKLKI